MNPFASKTGRLWTQMLTVLALVAAAPLHAAEPAPSCMPEPIYDTGCRLSPRTRAARLAWLDRELLTPAREELLRPATIAYEDYTDYLRAMNQGYIASDVLFVASTALLTFGDGAQIAALIKAGNWIKLGSFAVMDGIVVARTVYTQMDFKQKVLASAGMVDLRTREDLQALSELSLQQLINENDGARAFLSQTDCGGGAYPSPLNQRIQTTYEHLSAWHEDATRGYDEPTRWMEWWSHARGNHVAQYQLPYASSLVAIFSVNVAYLETIKQLLIEDGIRCASRARETAQFGMPAGS